MEVFVVIVTFAELFLHVLREFFYYDVDKLAQGVVVFETLRYLANSLT